MDKKIKKLMTMQKPLLSRHDIDRLYVSRNGRRWLDRIVDCVDAIIQVFEENTDTDKQTKQSKAKKD